MTKRQWDKSRRNLRVIAHGADPASNNARSRDFLLTHLIPTTAERAQYLDAIKMLLHAELRDMKECEHWFEKVSHLDSIVPRWVVDDDVTHAKAALQSRLQLVQTDYERALREQHLAILLIGLERLENAVAQGRLARITVNKVQDFVDKFSVYCPALSPRVKTSLRVRLRQILQNIFLVKRTRWQAHPSTYYPDQDQWEAIFQEYL